MSQAVQKHNDLNKLVEAAACNLHVACYRAGEEYPLRSRLLHLDAQGLRIDMPAGPQGTATIPRGESLEVTFRSGTETLQFVTSVLAVTTHRFNDDVEVSALLLAEPKALEIVQRREAYRVSLVDQDPVDVTIWPVEMDRNNPHAKPRVCGELHGQLFDVSSGGVCVLTKDDTLVQEAAGRQLWIRFALPGEKDPLTFIVEYRHHRVISASGMHTHGLRFVEYAKPSEQRLVTEKIAQFVTIRQREQLSRRKDR
jgi:c-di-GMP-binding flagellar brake protein YcgR